VKVIIPSELEGADLYNANGEYVPIDEVVTRDKRIAELEAELHAIKYEVMGGEDAPGSANLATVDDVRREMERLRAIDRRARK
jgi:hypothetical protein